MLAREVGCYDANTLRRLRAIDLHNTAPSAELGGFSPHALVFGPRETSSLLMQDDRDELETDFDVVGNLAYDALFDARQGRIRVFSSSVQFEELQDSSPGQEASSGSSSVSPQGSPPP